MYPTPFTSDEGTLSDPFHRHAFLVILLGLLFLLLSACGDSPTAPNTGGDGGGGGNGGGDEPAENEVVMMGTSFTPANIQIEVGETVTWRNQSSMTHTVTSGSNRDHNGEFDSGNLGPGATYQVTFTEAGEFDYFCIPHVGMAGSVTVVESSDS